MGPVVVVVVDEGVEQGLELADRRRLTGLCSEPLLHGLLEALDLPAGGRVVRSGVLLHDTESVQLGLEGVAAVRSSSQSGGEHHALNIGERGDRNTVVSDRIAEAHQHHWTVTRGWALTPSASRE